MNIKETVEKLQEAADLYYNEGESTMTDAEFDKLERELRAVDPENVYFLGVGAEERGDKVPLPVTMGSLDQLQEGEVEQWIKKHNLEDEMVVATEKLDGTSVLLVYGNNGELQIAFSRGNGTEGADITRHIKRIKHVPQKISGPMIVRCESILPIKDWDRVREEMKQIRDGEYKNARNWAAGQMNKKEATAPFYNNIHIVAYSIEKDSRSKMEQLDVLTKEGFHVADMTSFDGEAATDEMLSGLIQSIKAEERYEIDGIVLDVNSNTKRQAMPGKASSLNPGYARKYKVGCEDNQAVAEVVKVHWKTSKHGLLKPRIEIKPVDLVGVTITFCTGFNAKFIEENGVGPGATFTLVRSGDVIPYFKESLTQVEPDMPTETNVVWDGVELMLTGESEDVKFQQLLSGFAKLAVDHAGGGNLQKMFDAGYTDLATCIKLDEQTWKNVAGDSAGSKIFKSLHEKLSNVKLAALAAASSVYERGIGERKLQPVIDVLGELPVDLDAESYSHIEGVAGGTAQKIVEGNVKFAAFLKEIDGYYGLAVAEKRIEGGSLDGMYFVFTGVRDKDLEQAIAANGGEVGSSMSKVTCLVAKDPNSTSGKAKKAREKGIKIVSHAEAKEMV